MLCKIVESTLQIKRSSQYKNRIQTILSSSSRSHSNKLYRKVLEGKLENSIGFTQACTNFLEVYCHIQEQLNKNFPPEIKTVKLKRFIANSRVRGGGVGIPDDTKYSELIVKLYSSAKLLELPTIIIPMDFINSYTQANENSHGGLIALHQDIPFQDVLYSYQLISQLPGYPDRETTCVGYSEENEWVVMNQSPTEMETIPIQNIELLDKDFELKHQITSIEEAQAFMLQYKNTVKHNKLDFYNIKLKADCPSFLQKLGQLFL